jgi:hypothetical protein
LNASWSSEWPTPTGVTTSWLLIGAGADDLIGQALRAFATSTNLVLFPPRISPRSRMAARLGLTPLSIQRSIRMGVDLDRAGLPASAETPSRSSRRRTTRPGRSRPRRTFVRMADGPRW